MGEKRGSSSGGKSRRGQAKQQSQEVAQQGQQKASEAAEQGREKTAGQLDTQKERAAGQIEGISRALRQTGEQLREQDQGSIGNYADQGAEQAERLANFLQEKEGEELIREVEDFARNRTAVFLGGAFVVGVAAARFLKSSAGQRESFDVQGRARELGEAATGANAGASSGSGGGE